MRGENSDKTIVSEPKGEIEQNLATRESRIVPNPVPQNKAQQCKICGQLVTGQKELDEHMKSHEARSVSAR